MKQDKKENNEPSLYESLSFLCGVYLNYRIKTSDDIFQNIATKFCFTSQELLKIMRDFASGKLVAVQSEKDKAEVDAFARQIGLKLSNKPFYQLKSYKRLVKRLNKLIK